MFINIFAKNLLIIMISSKFIGIIPARFASTRLPGKPLSKIGNKTMIQLVYERISSILEHVVVATDDQRIIDKVQSFGGKAVMTSEHHKSGTSRCAEALEIINKTENIKFDVVINIQGDEPFIVKEQLFKIMKCFENPGTQIATLIKKTNSFDDIFNPSKPKVIVNTKMEAIYFSRSPIPYVRDVEKEEWALKHNFYTHIGIYAYTTDCLREIVKLSQSSLEKAESLEQNCWIENNYKIITDITDFESFSIDTPADLEKAQIIFMENENK